MKSLYNLFLEKIILPFGDILNGSSVSKELNRWRSICKLNEKEIADLSEKNLKDILNFAVDRIEFYKNINPEYHADPYEWIKQFPVMRKSDVKQHLGQLLSVPKEKLIKFSSSGSSGIQGVTYQSEKELSANRAMQMLWWEWAGYHPGKKLVQTGMDSNRSLLKKSKDILFRTKYVHAFKSQENELLKLFSELSNKSGFHLGGYASSLNVMAETALRHNLHDVHFDAAISWGDKLFDKYKKNIKEAFGCHVFETYGCAEGFLVAAKKDLDYFYIMSPHIYVEILDKDDNPVPDGEMGYVVLTRLDNYSMPLIRYYVGDLGIKLPHHKYPEKREMYFPLLERIIGRDTDVVRTRSGKHMIVHAFTGIFEYVPEIIQFRVIQRVLDEIEIEYIADPAIFNEQVLTNIEKQITDNLAEKINITWSEVVQIPSTPSGKPQIIQSFI
jgi:phenylacetate-CoA ligase